MCLYILEQLVCCEELRIATHNLDVLIGTIREIHKVLHNCKQSVFTEQTFYHRYKGTDTVQFLILGIDLSPGIEEIIRAEERAVFVIRTITDNDKCVIFENLRNVSAITHSQLLIRIHDGGIFFDCALELKDNDRNAVDEHNAIRDTQLVVDTLDLELINRLENIVFGSVEINKFNIDVLLRSILTVENEAITKQLIESLVCFIQSTGNITQHKEDTINLTRCDAILCIAIIQILLQIVL